MDNSMARRIKELRKSRNVTQRQLADDTGLSIATIKSYETGLREPNSKAMAALEKYFRVSGEYLRGEINREQFLQNSANIQGSLDDVITSFQSFREGMACSPQEEQLQAVDILQNALDTPG